MEPVLNSHEEQLVEMQKRIDQLSLAVINRIHDQAQARHRLESIRLDRTTMPEQVMDAARYYRLKESDTKSAVFEQIEAYINLFRYLDSVSSSDLT